jgi:hypothetical protein
MKKLFFLTLITGLMFTAIGASAQIKQKPSPADTVKGTIKGGVDVTIAYSQPGIKGRTLGKEIATYGKLWRTGANEQTAITFSKDVKIEGNELPAGKYSIWSIPGETEWVIIINKNTTNWGTDHDEASDLFKFTVKTQKAKKFAERFKFSIEKSGKISFVWGDALVSFNVKS